MRSQNQRKLLPLPTRPRLPLINRSAGVELYQRGSSQKVSAQCSISTLSGEHPGAPDMHRFTKSQQRGSLWCARVPAIQQRVTWMTPPWLLFPPEKHAARLTACQTFLAPQNSRAKNTPVSPSGVAISNCAEHLCQPLFPGTPQASTQALARDAQDSALLACISAQTILRQHGILVGFGKSLDIAVNNYC